jgi:hypothetical protein
MSSLVSYVFFQGTRHIKMSGTCLRDIGDMSQTYIVSCFQGALGGHVFQRHFLLRSKVDLESVPRKCPSKCPSKVALELALKSGPRKWTSPRKWPLKSALKSGPRKWTLKVSLKIVPQKCISKADPKSVTKWSSKVDLESGC